MPTEITLRRNKSQPLTFDEVDNNFENLKTTADAAATGSGLSALTAEVASIDSELTTLTGRVDTIEGDYTTAAQAETIADAAVAAHVALPDPHAQYLTDAKSVSFAATKSAADSLAAGLGDGATVITDRDETAGGVQTRRVVTSGVLGAPVNELDAGQVGANSGRSVQSHIDDVLIQAGAGSGKNIIVHPTVNKIASDLSAVTISGGGNALNPNLIAYTDDNEKFTGNASDTVFTTTFDVTNPADVDVVFIRADKVLINVTTQSDIVMSGTKAQVTYPRPGHFVNDGIGGAEGLNPALLTTQAIRVTRKTKLENLGSGSIYSAISYGYDNIIVTGVMQHASGAHQRISGGDHNTIFGGSYGRIEIGSYGSIFGGTGNEILGAGNGSCILGSINSLITLGPGTILGGSNHLVNGAFASVFGGNGNSALANGATVTGRSNTVSGVDGFAAGGSNTVSATYSFALGFQNTVSGSGYSAAWGRQNTVSGQYSSAWGYLNTVSAAYATAKGRDAVADKPFSDVIGGERIDALGDNQTTVLVVRRQTTNATPTALRLGAAAARLTIADDTTWAFTALIVGRRTDADNESAAYEVKGCIDRNAGTVAFVGTPSVTVIAEDSVAWDVTLVADNTNKALEINVTGESAKTINWVGRVTLAEVTG